MKYYLYESIGGMIVGVLFVVRGFKVHSKSKKYGTVLLVLGWLIVLVFFMKFMLWFRLL